jgi:regulatory protein
MVLYLRRKRLADEVADEVLRRLEGAGYLNDAEFARFWVENRQRFRPRSRRALSHELRQKGIDSEAVAEAVIQEDDDTAAWQAIEARLPRWSELSTDELRQKISGYLARRGFGYTTINQVYREACRMLQAED